MKSVHVADLYDYIYSWKMYQAEADRVKEICKQYLNRPMDTLLEWACGTGRYLECFPDASCIGVDLCQRSLEHARRRAPNAELVCADMAQFRPEKRVDVLIALFGAIGYLDPNIQLLEALKNAYTIIDSGGLMIIEPWVSIEKFKDHQAYLQTYRSLNLQIARMVVSDHVDMQSLLRFEYLYSLSGGTVQRLSSVESLWLCDTLQLEEMIEKVGFTLIEQISGFMPDSSLWICRK